MPATEPSTAAAGGAAKKKRPTSIRAPAGWVAIQKKTFTRWCNSYLVKRGMHIDDLVADVGDGLAMHALLETIGDEKLPRINKKPRLRIQKLENCGRCFEYLKKKEIKLVGIGSSDLVDGNEKLILGLIWTVILRFEVADAGDKAGLLLWCKRSTQGYDGVGVKNFTGTWNDGRAFCALIHRYRPDLLARDEWLGMTSEEALERAFAVAEQDLGIMRFLDVEDVADNVRPDEKSIVAYVSQFFKLFAGMAKNEALIKCIAKAVATTRRHRDWIEAYTEGSGELLAWVQRTASEHAGGDHGDASEAVKAKLDAFRAHLVDDVPGKQKQKVELEGTYASLCSSVRNNGRPGFAPAIKPSTVQVCWEAMQEADRGYENALRDRLLRFLRADAECARLGAKMTNVEAWLDEKAAHFAADFDCEGAREAADALEARADAHAQCEKRHAQYDQVVAKVRGAAEACAADAEVQTKAR